MPRDPQVPVSVPRPVARNPHHPGRRSRRDHLTTRRRRLAHHDHLAMPRPTRPHAHRRRLLPVAFHEDIAVPPPLPPRLDPHEVRARRHIPTPADPHVFARPESPVAADPNMIRRRPLHDNLTLRRRRRTRHHHDFRLHRRRGTHTLRRSRHTAHRPLPRGLLPVAAREHIAIALLLPTRLDPHDIPPRRQIPPPRDPRVAPFLPPPVSGNPHVLRRRPLLDDLLAHLRLHRLPHDRRIRQRRRHRHRRRIRDRWKSRVRRVQAHRH